MPEDESRVASGDGARLICDLSALDPTQQKRRLLLQQLLQVGTAEVIELPNCYAIQIDAASIIARHLEEFAALERLCCPFLTIAVRTSTGGARPVLEIGGSQVIKEFIAAQFGI